MAAAIEVLWRGFADLEFSEPCASTWYPTLNRALGEHMDAANLRVFEAVARTGQMSRAAVELNTVQSNVTARIRALEEYLGVSLFDRHSRGAVLTEAGKRLLPFACRVRQLLHDARRAVEDEGIPFGPLRIGAPEVIVALHLSPVLAAYAGEFPEVSVTLTTGATKALLDQVLNHALDGAFLVDPAGHPEIDEEALFRDELAIFAASGVDLEEVAHNPHTRLVTTHLDCAYHQKLMQVMAVKGARALRSVELGTIEAVLTAVATGVGITMLPKALVYRLASRHSFSIRELSGAELVVGTTFVRRREIFVPSALSTFLDRVRASSNGRLQTAGSR